MSNDKIKAIDSLNAIITAETGYALASYMLKKGNLPTILDMRKGITTLIPQFSSCFAKAYVLENSTVDWVRGGKTNLVEGSYDRMEERVNYCLDILPLKTGTLAKMAPAVYAEHDNGYRQHNGVVVVPPSNDSTELLPSFIQAYAANKAVFYGSMCLSLVRPVFPDTFNPNRNFALSDLQSLADVKLVSAEDLDTYQDHAQQMDSGEYAETVINPLDDAAWDITPADFNSVSEEGLGFNDAKALDNAVNLRDATLAWMSYATDTELLKEEIEQSRQNTLNYIAEQEKGSVRSMFTGKSPEKVTDIAKSKAS